MRKEVIAELDPKSPISEIFRTLRTNIQFMNTKGKLKSILVTSTLPGEGKSWISANLAVTFAQAGKKVVIIDADMRKGRQYAIFGVSPRPGLSNYLSGMVDGEEISYNLENYIQETEVENLYVISAGNVPPNPSELLVAPQMIGLLDQLKEICDIIVIDGTPSQLVADSLVLTRLVDSTIIVTAEKYTKKEDLKRTITNIQNVGGKIAGIVVNKVTMSAKKYEQSYYYGSTSMRNTRMSTKSAPARRSAPARKSNAQMYNRTSNLLKNNVQDSNNKNVEEITQNSNQNDEQPKTLNREIKIENKEEISIEKTNDILNQINKYLDEEKKKLN